MDTKLYRFTWSDGRHEVTSDLIAVYGDDLADFHNLEEVASWAVWHAAPREVFEALPAVFNPTTAPTSGVSVEDADGEDPLLATSVQHLADAANNAECAWSLSAGHWGPFEDE